MTIPEIKTGTEREVSSSHFADRLLGGRNIPPPEEIRSAFQLLSGIAAEVCTHETKTQPDEYGQTFRIFSSKPHRYEGDRAGSPYFILKYRMPGDTPVNTPVEWSEGHIELDVNFVTYDTDQEGWTEENRTVAVLAEDEFMVLPLGDGVLNSSMGPRELEDFIDLIRQFRE